jgi:hypothetical protein
MEVAGIRACHMLSSLITTAKRELFGANIIREAEKQLQNIRENLRIAQPRQKS